MILGAAGAGSDLNSDQASIWRSSGRSLLPATPTRSPVTFNALKARRITWEEGRAWVNKSLGCRRVQVYEIVPPTQAAHPFGDICSGAPAKRPAKSIMNS